MHSWGFALREGVFAETKEGICRNKDKKRLALKFKMSASSSAVQQSGQAAAYDGPNTRPCTIGGTYGHALESFYNEQMR